jgi:hypothetical protein
MIDKKPIQSPAELAAYRMSVANEPLETPEQTPEAATSQPEITIRPGSHHAAAASKVGQEDEYINRMSSRYGGEW